MLSTQEEQPTLVQRKAGSIDSEKFAKEDQDELLAYNQETETTESQTENSIWNYTPLRQLAFLGHLFFAKKFFYHRVMGLVYLLQYAAAFVYYFADYKGFKASPLIWSLPLTGVIQSITAIYTFTFLPKRTKDPGYFSDKYTMNYPFIVENSFFALLLLYQWLYMDDSFYKVFQITIAPEVVFVFFPYVLRMNWPQTRFRDSLESTKSKTDENQFFYKIAIQVTKMFYIWAKHYIGYFLNYARFMDRISDTQIKHIYMMLISSAFATTIAVFLHTLKFRKMIGPRLSFMIYFVAYMSTFVSYFNILEIFFVNKDLSLIALGGLIINFGDRKLQIAYQMLVFGALFAARYGMLPEQIVLPLGH